MDWWSDCFYLQRMPPEIWQAAVNVVYSLELDTKSPQNGSKKSRIAGARASFEADAWQLHQERACVVQSRPRQPSTSLASQITTSTNRL